MIEASAAILALISFGYLCRSHLGHEGAMPREQKITLGEMRSSGGPTRLLVYCSDFKCSHSVVVGAAPWGDNVRLSDLEPKFTCKPATAHRR